MSELINLDFFCNAPLQHKLKYEIGICKLCPIPLTFSTNNLPELSSVLFEIEWIEDGITIKRNLNQTEIKLKNNVTKFYLIISFDGNCINKLDRTEFNINVINDCRNGDFSLFRLNTFTICIK